MFTRSSILTVSTLIIGGLSVGHFARRLPVPVIDIRFGSEIPLNVAETWGIPSSGPEVVMAFVGSPNCGFSTDPEVAQLIREAAACLRERATSLEASLVSVGVSPVWIPGEGWRYLERIMNFDEVVIGRNWLNSEIVDLAWAHSNARVATPQIIVYKQRVVLSSESETGRTSISREAPTVRVTGKDEIGPWVEAGCPLDWRY
jgi:hypothetical protein